MRSDGKREELKAAGVAGTILTITEAKGALPL